MLFLGGGSEKVNFKNHQFYAIFYQTNEDSKVSIYFIILILKSSNFCLFGF